MPDFFSQTRVLNRYSPFGNKAALFDANLDFGTGKLDIKVKLYFDFGLIFFNTTGYTKERWLKKYFAQIDNYWGSNAQHGKYRILVTGGKSSRTYELTPRITAEPVRSATDAHFAVNVKHFHLGRSFVSDSNNQTKECVLYADAVKAMPKGPATKLAWKLTMQGTREDLLAEETENLLRELKLELEFEPDLKQFTDKALAAQMKTHLNQLGQCYPGIKLVVTGYRPSSRTKIDKSGREVALAAIQALNLSAFAVAADGGKDSFRLDPYVKFELERTTANVMNRLSDFPIAAHEFGHKLGNLDEYKNPFDKTGRREIERFAADVGVMPPVWDSHTPSLMSLGDVVLPCHYVPLAKVVDQMYEDFVGTYPGDLQEKNDLLTNRPRMRIQ